jgi:nitroreductase
MSDIPVPEDAIVERDFFEVIGTQRAMRRLKTDPVPEDLIKSMIWAATRAPSGGNRQPWRFLVVTDPEKKAKLKEWYRPQWYRLMESGYGRPEGMTDEQAASNERVMKSATYLADHLDEAPVIIFPAIFRDPGSANQNIIAGSSIYPAVQNLMLAARALGLGTTLTTLHRAHHDDVRELLGVPETVELVAMIPVGWPKGNFGSGYRRPVEDVTYWEQWGEKRS